MKACNEITNQEYALGALPPAEKARLEEHLAACAGCSRQIEEYLLLFRGLAQMPMPAVPADLEYAVMARLLPQPIGLRWRWELPFAVAGALIGLLIAAFRQPLLLLCGRLAGGVVTYGSSEFVGVLRQTLDGLTGISAVVHTFVRTIQAAGPLVRALGDALRTLPGQTSVLSIVLTLATVLLLGGLVGHLRREKLSHAER